MNHSWMTSFALLAAMGLTTGCSHFSLPSFLDAAKAPGYDYDEEYVGEEEEELEFADSESEFEDEKNGEESKPDVALSTDQESEDWENEPVPTASTEEQIFDDEELGDYEEISEKSSLKQDLAGDSYRVPEDDELSRFLKEAMAPEPVLGKKEKGGLASFSGAKDPLVGEEEALMVEHVHEQVEEEIPQEVSPKSYKERKLAQQWKAEHDGGFFRLRTSCEMHSEPDGQKLGVIAEGRRLWTSPHSAKWLKVYRKKGVAYISKACI